MSIKEIVKKELCYICTLKNCSGNCEEVNKEATKITQQIISEIVGELEKLPIFLVETNDGKTKKWEHALFKDEVIEIIKKMGEV